ncbi:MAG: NADH-quinone oxidoreductase subunit C, partial [Terriglobales bacterium]
MDFEAFGLISKPISGAVPASSLRVNADQLRAVCAAVADEGGLLQALWGSDERDREGGFLVHVALQHTQGLLIIDLPVTTEESAFPNLSEIFPSANRMQRAVDDMLGLTAWNSDSRPWLRHGSWPVDYFPLRRDAGEPESPPIKDDHYRFVSVKGNGVHEIAVGPVHAGVIEPGHFRLSVVGEKVLRLEERFGYTHKGIEKRFESLPLTDGHRLAARISGDSAVAFSWAYCMAAEAVCDIT